MQPVQLPAPEAKARRVYRTLAVSAVLAFGAVSAGGTAASSQGLLDTLFGTAKPAPPSNGFTRSPYPPYLPYPQSSRPSAFEGGSYRTVCVRMCDGFYFPISFGVSRAQFGRDAAACQSSCGVEARLFYAPTSGSSEDMVDLAGRSYAAIPNAFKYRKALVANCACKPAPWSEAELARHQLYAAADARTKGNLIAQVSPAPAPAPLAAGRPETAPPARMTVHEQMPSRAPPAAGDTSTENEPLPGRIALPRPAPVQLERTAQASLQPPRPSPGRMGVGGPPPAAKSTAKTSTKPVYSYELGRFVFPGENR